MREQQVDRLTRLLAEHEQLAAEEAAELPDRAAFDPSPGFERHRRYRTALGRELLRTLDTLRKLRKDGWQMADVGYIPIVSLTKNKPTMERKRDCPTNRKRLTRTGACPTRRPGPKKPNEAKLLSPQDDISKELASQNSSEASAERTHFPGETATNPESTRRCSPVLAEYHRARHPADTPSRKYRENHQGHQEHGGKATIGEAALSIR